MNESRLFQVSAHLEAAKKLVAEILDEGGHSWLVERSLTYLSTYMDWALMRVEKLKAA